MKIQQSNLSKIVAKVKYKPSITEKNLFYELHLLGLKPKNQYKIGNMHVDIAFPEEMLVIEVNGPHHDIEPQKSIDIKRLNFLKSRGWKVKIFGAETVYKYTSLVAQKIKEEIDKIHNTVEPVKVKKEKIAPKSKTKKKVLRSRSLQIEKPKKTIKNRVIVVVLILFIIILTALALENKPSTKFDIEEIKEIGPAYNQLYSDLNVGMSAKDFGVLIFNNRFELYPYTGETKEFTLFRFSPDKQRIIVYFDDVAQVNVYEDTGIIVSPGGSSSRIEFTDAKLIKVEFYYGGEKIAEK